MKKKFRVIVAGGRDFNNYNLLCEKLNALLANRTEEVVIVSGMAKGADYLGAMYAQNKNIVVSYFPALWQVHGNQAGFIRNKEMANNADACVCFWDGKSTGTKDMIETAENMKLSLRVIKY
jgi:hypothetical protein